MIGNHSPKPPGNPRRKTKNSPSKFQEVDASDLSRKEMMDDIMRMIAVLEALGSGASMQVFVKDVDGNSITLDVKDTDTIDKVKAILYDKRHTLTFAGKQLKEGAKTLSENSIQAESTLHESGKLAGGVRGGIVKKHHLKDADAFAELKRKATASMVDVEMPDPSIELGADFKKFLSGCHQNVEALRVAHAGGTNVIEAGLRGLSSEKLKAVREVLSFKEGRKGSSEERLSKVVGIIFTPMIKMMAAKTTLGKSMSQMTETLMHLYIDVYACVSDGSAKYDHTKFLEAVKDEELRKKHVKADRKKRGEKESSSEDETDVVKHMCRPF
jgi:hypothetical protein